MRVFAVLTIGFAALGLLRRQSAAARHWALAVAISCAAMVPVLQIVVPSWRLPARSETAINQGDGNTSSAFATATSTSRQQSATVPPRATAAPSLVDRLLPWLFRIQWAGALLGLFILIVGLARLEWIAARAAPVESGRLAQIWRELLNELRISRPVRLRQTDHGPLLMTWGAFHPIVVLPRAADQWSDARVRAVLCHELAHVRRGDWLPLMLAEVLRAVDWVNPLTWLAARRLRFESELACDDVVLAAGIPAPEYAGHLLAVVQFARRQHRGPMPLASAMARAGGIERRVEAMLNGGLTRVPVSRFVRVLSAASLLAGAALISGYGVAAQSLTSVTGAVYDPQNLGVPRVLVSLTNPKTEARHEVPSDATGHFEFVGLPPGDYQLEARVGGFAPSTRSLTIIGRPVVQDLTLSLGAVSESITLAYSPDQATPLRPTAVARPTALSKQPACEASASGGKIQPPLKLRNVPPVYPIEGQPSEEGLAVIDARIGVDGSVVSAIAREPVSADLATAAITAVNQWQFTPTLLNCVPVEVAMTVKVRFERK